MRIHAEAALLPEHWARDVAVQIEDGIILSVSADTPALPNDLRVETLIPGMPNLHSHTFQRGFSGLTEWRGSGPDSFWTWRDTMYRFALKVDPDAIEAIAALACVEMLEAGYTRLGEFHYLHHAPDGRPYDDLAETSKRIFAAAETTGIALTHLPVFYAHGGFGGAEPSDGQRRFLHERDDFDRLMQSCAAGLSRPQDRLGLAPHSLRAATLDQIRHLATHWPGRAIHIHIAEQVKEVEDCLAHTGARPVEYLLNSGLIDQDWTLIHATHLSDSEIADVAVSGAVAGLCPVTEANLGDGIFAAPAFLGANGAIGIGTDSNVAISVAHELQMLEYSQRLSHRCRNICSNEGSTGETLFRAALRGGTRALAAPGARLDTGAPADLVALRDTLSLSHPEYLLDRWIFGKGIEVDGVWAAGRQVVKNGRHFDGDRIRRDTARVLRALI